MFPHTLEYWTRGVGCGSSNGDTSYFRKFFDIMVMNLGVLKNQEDLEEPVEKDEG